MGARLFSGTSGARRHGPSANSVDAHTTGPAACIKTADPPDLGAIKPAMHDSSMVPQEEDVKEAAEAHAWELLLRLESLFSEAVFSEDGLRFVPPKADALRALTSEAEEVLGVAPPTDFALIAVAAQAIAHDATIKATMHAGNHTADGRVDTAENPHLILHEGAAKPQRDSSTARGNSANTQATVISLANCLSIAEDRGAQTVGRCVNQRATMSPRTAALRASKICTRYRNVIDVAANNASRELPFHKQPRAERELSGVGASRSSTFNTMSSSRRDPAAIQAATLQIFERYHELLVTGNIDCFEPQPEAGCAKQACESISQFSHVPLDAGSGGTAGSSSVRSTRPAKLVGGSGGTYSSDGTSDGDSARDNFSPCRSPVGAINAEKQKHGDSGPHPILQEKINLVPWTYSFFFDDDDYGDHAL